MDVCKDAMFINPPLISIFLEFDGPVRDVVRLLVVILIINNINQKRWYWSVFYRLDDR